LILSEPHNKAVLKSQTGSDDGGLGGGIQEAIKEL
jgi:hypothetical protein